MHKAPVSEHWLSVHEVTSMQSCTKPNCNHLCPSLISAIAQLLQSSGGADVVELHQCGHMALPSSQIGNRQYCVLSSECTRAFGLGAEKFLCLSEAVIMKFDKLILVDAVACMLCRS